MLRATGLGVAMVLLASGCSRTPTQPRERSEPVLLIAYCNPDGIAISCSAFVSDAPGLPWHADVTATSVWSAEPADAVSLVTPGRFTALREGEVEIRAQYRTWPSSPPNPRFLVAPDAVPRQLSAAWVLVREFQGAESNNAPVIAGALVRLVEGYRPGTTCTTSSSGMCKLDPVTTREPYTFVVSKDGYRPADVLVRGDLGAPTPVPVWLSRQ